MNHHLRILQKRIETVAVRARKNLQCSVRPRGGQNLERARHKIIQRQEKDLYSGQNDAHIRHQFPILIPISK